MNNTNTPMTDYERRKIVEAISECQRFIDIESPRSADLRPADVAQHLAFCHTHKAKLIKMLEAR